MDDVYDVRAVEARLARMEAARRARAGSSASSKPAALAPSAHRATVVGDFELSAMDSSASEDELDSDASASTSSASDQDDAFSVASKDPMGRKKKNKARLPDSLDLSMSVSVALPAGKPIAPARSKAGFISNASVHGSRSGAAERATAGSDVVGSYMDPHATASVTSVDPLRNDDPFAGKLVQRRRELERMAGQQAQHIPPPRGIDVHELPRDDSERKGRLQPSCSDVALPPAVKAELKQPAVMLSRTHRNDDTKTAPELEQPHGTSKWIPDRQSAKVPEPSLRPMKDALKLSARPSGVSELQEKRLEPATHRTVAVPVQPPVPGMVAKPTDTPAATKRGSEMPSTTGAAPPPPIRQTLKQPPALRQPAGSEVLTVSLASAPVSKKMPSVPIDVPPPVAASTIPIPNNKPPGYARSNASSNQSPAPLTQTAKKIASPVKREPEDHPSDDVIDDLLTAEELRLRESLDKLTNRLSSLTAARTAQAAKAVRPSSNQSAAPNAVESDDTKTIRSASYGGGAHSRLHQPTSPTSRASHAKRSELSGGVHKARVRIGGVAAQEAAANRTDMTADGKHKIVVKRDLAHLLF